MRYCHLSHAIAGRNAEDFNGTVRCRACASAWQILTSAGVTHPSASLFEAVADGRFVYHLGWIEPGTVLPGRSDNKWSREAVTAAERQQYERVINR